MLSLIAALSLAAAIVIVITLTRLVPQLFAATLAANARRTAPIDGARGILASAVVIHHSITMQGWIVTGRWDPPVENFQNQLGSTAVAVFFMISAHLFCRPLITSGGKLDIFRLFEGRVTRIFPLYFACVAALILYVAILSGFTLNEPIPVLLRHIGSWMTFGFFRQEEVNQIPASKVLMSQIWTLRYEWILYGSLPPIALAMRLTNQKWLIYIALFLAGVFVKPLFFLFVAGTLAGDLARLDGPRWRIAWQILGIAGLLTVLLGFHNAVDWPQAALLTPLFVAVLHGDGLYARLGGRGLRFIGEISFSIYLIHVFVLWAISHWIMDPNFYASLGPVGSLPVFTAVLLIAIGVSALTYTWIERPLMRWRPITSRRSATS